MVFSRLPSVPLLSHSKKEFDIQPNTLNQYNQYVARQTGILFLIAMDYVNIIREFRLVAADATLKLRFLRFGCLFLSHRIMNTRPYRSIFVEKQFSNGNGVEREYANF
ncbi:hypothetical protein T06_8703 [Trichinella sp. T6]|nr:hypothetical protein T06_8703 [Trichinella sp. T6]